jgi:hypothetical protein
VGFPLVKDGQQKNLGVHSRQELAKAAGGKDMHCLGEAGTDPPLFPGTSIRRVDGSDSLWLPDC